MAASWTTDTANLTCGTNISNYVVLTNNSANCPVYFNRALIFFPSALLCIIGAVGNGLLLLVLCRFLKPWNVANVFIANLALADLLFITSVLKYLLILWVKDVQWFNNMQHFRSMYEQNVMYIFIIAMNENASVLFLMFMTIDRYLAIVHPLRSRVWRTPCRAKVYAIFIWLGAFITALPTISFDWVIFTISAYAVLGFLIPLTVIVICYVLVAKSIRKSHSFHSRTHGNEKTMRLIVFIVGAFVVCWLPIHLSHLWIYLNRFSLPDMHNILVFLHYLNMMPVVNSCINPLLTGCFGENFRQGFRRVLLCRGPKKKQKKCGEVPLARSKIPNTRAGSQMIACSMSKDGCPMITSRTAYVDIPSMS